MFQKKKRRSETATAELEHFVATGLEDLRSSNHAILHKKHQVISLICNLMR